LHRESLTLRRDIGDKLGIADSLEGFAMLAAAQNRPADAVRLFATAETLRLAIHSPLPPSDREERDHLLDTARATLGETAFASVWQEGDGLTWEQATATLLAGDPGAS